MVRARVLLTLCVLLAAVVARAGGGPAGFLVVYDPDDPDSVVVANHYQQVRGIPERNMVPYAFNGMDGTKALALIGFLRDEIAKRGLAGQLQGIALAGYQPLGARNAMGGGSISLAGLLYNAPNVNLKADPKTYPHGEMNKAQCNPPQSPTVALDGVTPVNGATYWPVSHVGPTDRVALSPHAALAAIDAEKAADGQKPDGIVYWPLNGDIRSTTREGEINQVLPLWDKMGIKYTILDGVWVAHRHDIAGGVVGIAGTDVAQDNTYLPGAWVDHLTSYGGVLWDNYQMPCTDFLLAGAGGSAGTMDEPYAISAKFPHAHIYTHFRNGANLAEAFWESIGMLNEILPVGDPLMQPYATFPKVTLTAPVTLKGIAALKATTDAPHLDLYVDGLRTTATRTTTGFMLDANNLPDGWHELRAVATSANAVRTQAEAVAAVTVNNHGQALHLTGPAKVSYTDPALFTVTASNLPADAKITLRANGRVLAAGVAGALTVPAKTLPYEGAVRLFAVATLPDGSEVWSAPLPVTAVWTPLPAAATEVAQGVGRVRFFADTADKAFNWDTTTPTAQGTLTTAQCKRDYVEFRHDVPLPGIVDDWTKVDYSTHPGLEYDTLFYADATDVYEFRFEAGKMTIDDQTPPGMKNGLVGPLPLAAGWHRVQLRFGVPNDKFEAYLYLRGGRVGKLLPLPSAWCATPAQLHSPGAPPVTIAKIATVTGVTLALTATAHGAAVTWSALRTPAIGASIHPDLPAEVKFTPNGTAEAANTTATFPMAGEYLLRCTAGADGTSCSTAEIPVTVQPTAMKVLLTAASQGTAAGYPIDLYGALVDQFGRRMPTAPALTWQSTPPGAFTALSADAARFRSGTAAGAYTVTASAGGITGTLQLPVAVHNGPQITFVNTSPTPQGIVSINTAATDPDDKHRLFPLTYKWEVVKQPVGQHVAPATADTQNTQLKLAAAGAYALKLTVTDGAGIATTNNVDIAAVANDDGTLEFTPAPMCGSGWALVGQPAGIYTYGYMGQKATFAWESSADNGKTWTKLPDTTQTLTLPTTTIADNGRLFRVTATNKAGTTTSKEGRLTVNDPEGGLLSVTEEALIADTTGTVTVTVHRTHHAKGKVTLDYRTMTRVNGLPLEKWAKEGEDYTAAKGTLTWADGDQADKTFTLTLLRPKAQLPARGFSVMLYNPTNNSVLLRYNVTVWLPSPDEPTPPKPAPRVR